MWKAIKRKRKLNELKPVSQPTEFMLEKSIKNSIKVMNINTFVLIGWFYFYATSRRMEFLLLIILFSLFTMVYFLAQKIDKARLELFRFREKGELK